MSEAEWLACNELLPLLIAASKHASERKVRLLACACCRRIWGLLGESSSRFAVEVAEQFADGQVGNPDRIAAYSAAAREAACWTNCCGVPMAAIGYAVAAAALTAMDPATIQAETENAGERVTDLLIMAEAIHENVWPDLWAITILDARFAVSTAAVGWADAALDDPEEDRMDWEAKQTRRSFLTRHV
jgi:hypothetical protein